MRRANPVASTAVPIATAPIKKKMTDEANPEKGRKSRSCGTVPRECEDKERSGSERQGFAYPQYSSAYDDAEYGLCCSIKTAKGRKQTGTHFFISSLQRRRRRRWSDAAP